MHDAASVEGLRHDGTHATLAATVGIGTRPSIRTQDGATPIDRPRAYPGSAPSTRQTFCPPKPNELEIACATVASRATFGTQSTGSAGSGVS